MQECERLVDRVLRVPSAGSVVIDVRSPAECAQAPSLAHLTKHAVLKGDTKGVGDDTVSVLRIPYYILQSRFADLEHDRTYLLYCDSGVMSRIQAAHLRARGYRNIAVLDPGAMDLESAL